MQLHMVFTASLYSGIRTASIVAIVLTMASIPSAEPISYSGAVRSIAGNAVSGARVWLEGTALSTYADANGVFTLSGDGSSASPSSGSGVRSRPSIGWRNGVLVVKNPARRPLRAQVFALDGEVVLNLSESREPEVALPLAEEGRSMSGFGIVVVRVIVDARVMSCKIVVGGKQERHGVIEVVGTHPLATGLGKLSASGYDLRATAPGYGEVAFPQTSAAASGLVLTLTPLCPDPVAGNGLTLVKPNGCESYHVGDTMSFTWENDSGQAALVIEFSSNNDLSSLQIGWVPLGTPAYARGPFLWEIPDTLWNPDSSIVIPTKSDSCVVTVHEYLAGGFSDKSDRPIRILGRE